MLNAIQYTGDLVPVELSARELDGVADLWMRKNPGTETDSEGNVIQTADEAYMVIPIDEAPDKAVVESNFDEWYDRAAAWTDGADTTDIEKRLAAAEAKNAELSSIIYTMMGVNIDG